LRRAWSARGRRRDPLVAAVLATTPDAPASRATAFGARAEPRIVVRDVAGGEERGKMAEKFDVDKMIAALLKVKKAKRGTLVNLKQVRCTSSAPPRRGARGSGSRTD